MSLPPLPEHVSLDVLVWLSVCTSTVCFCARHFGQHPVNAQDMGGLLMDTCNNIVWEGYDEFEVPTPRLSPPTGGSQTASVVVTGDSSGIVFQNCFVGPGAGTRGLLSAGQRIVLK